MCINKNMFQVGRICCGHSGKPRSRAFTAYILPSSRVRHAIARKKALWQVQAEVLLVLLRIGNVSDCGYSTLVSIIRFCQAVARSRLPCGQVTKN